MSAICGIYSYGNETFDFDTLHRMGRSMTLRGREQSGAYLNSGVGLLHNRMIYCEPRNELQPLTGKSLRGDKNITVVFDGEITNLASLAADLFLPPFSSSAQAVLECYKTFGNACPEHLDGAFAFAVFDEESKEIFLVRDKDGKKPLFYTSAKDEFVFASEPSAFAAYFESGMKVDSEMLAKQMCEPYLSIGAQHIFPEIKELRAGSYAVYSRIGFENFSYNTGYIRENSINKSENIRILPPLSDKTVGTAALVEILRAFGYPCFNYQILQLLELVRQEKTSGRRTDTAAYEDSLLYLNPQMSYEAADRIGMMYGIMCYPKQAEEGEKIRKRDLKKTEKKLCDICAKLYEERGFKSPVAKEVYDAALVEKELPKKIGMLGMIIQGEYWVEQNNLIFV